MQQQLNTPEDLRAIRQAMDEGKNPLVETDVPRWEDQVGISRIVNRRVLEFEVLPTPAQVLGDLPLSEQAQEIVAYSRDEIRACLYGCWWLSVRVPFTIRRPRSITRVACPR